MLQPVQVRALPGYRIWIEYSDGVRGEVDLSDMVGKGVFKAWDETGFFEKVHIDSEGAIVWDDGVELSEHYVYKAITGRSWDELPFEVEKFDGGKCDEWQLEPVEVKPLPNFHIWIRYNDGVCGEINLSDVAGKGVFEAWNRPGFFEKVHLTSHRQIAWDNEIDLCPDALYMELTGKSWDELRLYTRTSNAGYMVENA